MAYNRRGLNSFDSDSDDYVPFGCESGSDLDDNDDDTVPSFYYNSGDLKFKHLLKDDYEILNLMKSVAKSTKSTARTTSKPDNIYRRVINHYPSPVLTDILKNLIGDVNSIIEGRTVPKYEVSPRKVAVTKHVLSLLHEMSVKNEYYFKRQFFWKGCEIFHDQAESDAALDDICCFLGCTGSALNVPDAIEKGAVVGRLKFQGDNGKMVDCTKTKVKGRRIPLNMDTLGDISSDALCILLVEKFAAFRSLAYDKFYNRFPCIIVTPKGRPGVAFRLFLRMLKWELKLPVLALVNCDANSLKRLSAYVCGWKNMFYDPSDYVTPDIKWLGLRPSDLVKYEIPHACRFRMPEEDIKTAKELLEEDLVKKNPGWAEELNLMANTKQKAETCALSHFGLRYLPEVFLPLKLQQQDWL